MRKISSSDFDGKNTKVLISNKQQQESRMPHKDMWSWEQLHLLWTSTSFMVTGKKERHLGIIAHEIIPVFIYVIPILVQYCSDTSFNFQRVKIWWNIQKITFYSKAFFCFQKLLISSSFPVFLYGRFSLFPSFQKFFSLNHQNKNMICLKQNFLANKFFFKRWFILFYQDQLPVYFLLLVSLLYLSFLQLSDWLLVPLETNWFARQKKKN